MKTQQEELRREVKKQNLYQSGIMKKIKRIEILDGAVSNPNVLISLPSILSLITNGSEFNWAIVSDYEPSYIRGKAQEVSIDIESEISANDLALFDWKSLRILAEGVGQFINLVLLGCKDPQKLKPYKDDDEMLKECDIVIVAFDGCWWEVSCKDEQLMKKFLSTFKEVRIVNW